MQELRVATRCMESPARAKWVERAIVVISVAAGLFMTSFRPTTAVAADAPVEAGLTARNLVLIVNKNEPAGGRLAAFYAQQRHVPAGRVVELDLPTGDEVSFDDYNAKVVPVVRKFLADRKLEADVTCLVTFYGVPLRVGPRSNTPAEAAEYRDISAAVRQATDKAKDAVATAEDVARQVVPGYVGHVLPNGRDEEPDALRDRAEAAVAAAIKALPADADDDRRSQRFARLTSAVEVLDGSAETIRRLDMTEFGKLVARPPSPDRVAAARAAIVAQRAEVEALAPKMSTDAAARAKIRSIVVDHFGALTAMRVTALQKVRLETAETEAAVDSELACLHWPDDRLRHRWAESPLHYKVRFGPAAARAAAGPRTLMVARLDAPTEALARDLIATCVRVEAAGLKGEIALDARGKPPTDAYGRFDETFRQLASDLRFRTPVPVRLDDAEAVFQPGTARGVALYCGWYSLRNYVQGMQFAPGAVGYHVASLELISLHHPGEKGWVRGLMSDGVVASVGAVAEPYLHAFPPPNEFFPLLMTGRLKLAEVYWLTNPLVSWMNTLVGDPLYNPYAANPALKAEDVSAQLRVVFTDRAR